MVSRLPDPDPMHPDRPATGAWWPPAMLEPQWVEGHEFDLMHLHFGVDERTPAQLTRLVHSLAARDRPLVLTAHDLRSPHQADRTVLDEQLDVLVPAAAAVLTLTRGAADEIAARWGREAVVVPHPHLVELESMRRIRAERRHARPGRLRVGMSLKSLRPNVEPLRLLEPLTTIDEADLVVDVHRSWWERATTGWCERVRRRLEAAADRGDLELVVHDPFSDAELWRFVAGLDVTVLPYRFGTHSGWLEMCHDLGTSVVAPTLGHYVGQGVEASYRADEELLDGASVRDAVRRALHSREACELPGLDADARAEQRRGIVATHDDIYRGVLDRRASKVA